MISFTYDIHKKSELIYHKSYVIITSIKQIGGI